MLSFLITILKIIPGLLGIGLVIFLHELGHFIAARLLKVDVEVLSYGMGPKLFSIYGKNTEFRISAIPIGGYCRMKGSMDLTKALRDEAKSFSVAEHGSYFSTTPFVRFLIYLAGPLSNFLIAAIFLSIAALIPVERLSDKAIISPISEYTALFGIEIDQPELRKGDIALSSDDIYFRDYQELESFLTANRGSVIPLRVEREGAIEDITLYPVLYEDSYTYGLTMLQKPIIGRTVDDRFQVGDIITSVNGSPVEYTYDVYNNIGDSSLLTINRDGEIIEILLEGHNLPFAWSSELRKYSKVTDNVISYGFKEASEMFLTTIQSLGALLAFNPDGAVAVITGPVKAASTFGEISTLAFQTSGNSGLRALFYLLSIVSISICVGNLLPIPTFDGGQMLVNVIEMIKRKALKPRTYLILQIVGMFIGYLIIITMYAVDIKTLIFS